MDPELYFNITVFMQNNYYLLYGKQDEDKLQSLLATDLRNELMYHQFSKLVETIKLLRDCDELDFVWGLVKFANRNKWDREDLIYNQGDIAESLFFIYRGKVKLKGKSGKTVIKYRQGDTIGESDSLLGEERDAKAVAAEPCVLYQVETDSLQELFDRFPEQYESLRSEAELKRETHRRRIKQKDKNYGQISDQAAQRLQKMYGFQQKARAADKKALEQQEDFSADFIQTQIMTALAQLEASQLS